MRQHRVRLTDDDLAIIAAALRARLAMRRGSSLEHTRRLLERLEECVPGNPKLRYATDVARWKRDEEADEPEG